MFHSLGVTPCPPHVSPSHTLLISHSLTHSLTRTHAHSHAHSHSHPQGGAGRDEFEAELIADLSTEVVELRGVFNAYLEQLQAFEGADMEVLMVQVREFLRLLEIFATVGIYLFL